jgi:hypothetical protein
MLNISRGGDVEASATGFQASHNAFFATSTRDVVDDHALIFDRVAESENEPFCYTRKRITAPEVVCIDWALPTDLSPHRDHCDPELGAREGVGIDDALYDWL